MQSFFLRLLVFVAAAMLAGCASYEVTAGSDDNPVPLEPGSTDIVWKRTRTENVLAKQEKGFGIQPTVLSSEERREMKVVRDQVLVELAGNMVPKLKSSLGPYISTSYNMTKYVLQLELNRVMIDADGSRNITFTASLSEPPFGMGYWSRQIRIYVPRFSSNSEISTKAAEAVVAQLRSAAMIR
ncbi:MAG TPA: hypothetical protein VEC35_04790 [Noviherbaspirillum sp.]|nr:hypothetical protein [Noviherbaspirillum sp.]